MNVESLSPFIDFNRIQYYPSEFSPDLSVLAIAGNSHLILLTLPTLGEGGGGGGGSGGVGGEGDEASLLESEEEGSSSIALGFDQDAGLPTLLCWIDSKTICIGFDSGLLTGFDVHGQELFVFRGSTTAARALRFTVEKEGLRLWCLYEEKMLLTISLKQVCAKMFDEAIGYKLGAQMAVDDFIIYVRRAGCGLGLLDDDARDRYRVMVVGADSAVVIYELSNNSKVVEEDGQRSLKDKSSVFSKSLYSIFSAISSYTDSRKGNEDRSLWNRSKLFQASPLLILEDDKRRVFRVSLDPRGCLAATADSLGRVLLYDLRTEAVIRIWKGLRDARLGWMVEECSDKASGSVTMATILAIYAPQLGLVSLYKMRNGPCQRVVAVGLSFSMATTPHLRVSLGSIAGRDVRIPHCAVLKFVAKDHLLEVVPIKAGISSDLELEQVAQFVKDHQGNATMSASWEEDLRLSAMHASIREVMERDLKSRTSAPYSVKELSTLLNEWVSSQTRPFTSALDTPSYRAENDFIEKTILNILDRTMTCSSLLALVATIEYAELTGQVLSLYTEKDNICLTFPDQNMVIDNHDFTGSFSASFHQVLLEKINAALERKSTSNKDEKDSIIISHLREEVEIRKELLKAYMLFANMQSESTLSTSRTNLTPIQRDEVTQICKQNTFRAEALCWTLRSIKKYNASVDAPSRQKSPINSSSSATTPSTASEIGAPPNSLTLSPTKRITRVRINSPMNDTDSVASAPLQTTPRSASNGSSIEAIAKSVSPSSSLSSISKKPPVSFSLFRLFFTVQDDDQVCLRFQDLLQAVASFSNVPNSQTLPSSSVFSFSGMDGEGGELFTIESVDNFLAIMHHCQQGSQATPEGEVETELGDDWDESEINYRISEGILGHLMDLLFNALRGDLSSSHGFHNALKCANVHDPINMRDLLPLFVHFLAGQSLLTIASDILTKKMSVSPIQRWLRDHLLTMQDSFANYLSSDDELRDEFRSIHQARLEIMEGKQTSANPTFDQFARYLLRPAWSQCRSEAKLEAVFAFAAVLLETLYTVNDQVERRTFGADNLKTTITAWENLVRQLRLLLFVKSRAYHETPSRPISGSSFQQTVTSTLRNLSEGVLSLHRILATDSLIFALHSDQAREHESQCLEVYKRRSLAADGSVVKPSADQPHPEGSTSGKPTPHHVEVLLAWGKVADKRWRDLITMVMNEDVLDRQDGGHDPNVTSSAQRRRRKPLLLYFPEHNNANMLGAYRSIILAERWSQRIDKIDTLGLVCEHLFDISPIWRAVVALYIYSQQILPVMQTFVNLEEDHSSLLPLPERRKQLLNVMSDIPSMCLFVRYSAEVVNYILEGRNNNLSPTLQSSILLQFDLYLKSHRSGQFSDEISAQIWPSPIDSLLYNHFLAFYRDYASKERKELVDASPFMLEQWTNEALSFQLTLLSVLQLRFQCGLRGVKPSQLLTKAVYGLHRLAETRSCVNHLAEENWKELRLNEFLDEGVIQGRLEFIEQSFLRLIASQSPISHCSNLSLQWGFSKDLTRLLHAKALLEQQPAASSSGAATVNGRGVASVCNRDEELEKMIPLWENKDLVVDIIISAVRFRLGYLIAGLEQQAALYSSILSTMDSEAAAWAKAAVQLKAGCLVSAIALRSDEVSSSRQLIVFLEGFLLQTVSQDSRQITVPIQGINLNDGGINKTSWTRLEVQLGLSRCSSWLERKTRCDALLTLSTSLLQVAAPSSSSSASSSTSAASLRKK